MYIFFKSINGDFPRQKTKRIYADSFSLFDNQLLINPDQQHSERKKKFIAFFQYFLFLAEITYVYFEHLNGTEM